MRTFVLGVLGVLGVLATCCAGVRDSVATAHDEVRAQYCEHDRCDLATRLEYLGSGCYLVNDRVLYECTVDELPVGERLCMETSRGSGVQTTTSLRQSMPGPLPSWREVPISRRCAVLREDHDLRHGKRCFARVVVTESRGLDLDYEPTLELDEDTALALAAGLGKTWSGVSPLIVRREVCIGPVEQVFPDPLFRSTGFALLDRALHDHVRVVGGQQACTPLSIAVYGLERCAW